LNVASVPTTKTEEQSPQLQVHLFKSFIKSTFSQFKWICFIVWHIMLVSLKNSAVLVNLRLKLCLKPNLFNSLVKIWKGWNNIVKPIPLMI
jgi:hypothetical protein